MKPAQALNEILDLEIAGTRNRVLIPSKQLGTPSPSASELAPTRTESSEKLSLDVMQI